MASERQIAANRRNARMSTGPRSCGAKKRTSQNAYRYGLTLGPASSATFTKRLDKLARKIAGDTKSEIIREHARTAAHAVLDLARVRQVKAALIQSVCALGALGAPQDIFSMIRAYLYVELALEGKTPRGRPPKIPEPVDHSATMPSEPERTAEAIRRALPELVKLGRYESRAAARRDKAVRQIIENTCTPKDV